jgi:exonuclease III
MENTSVMSWNVRGLNDRSRRDTVRTLVDDVRPSIVCLQETKLAVIPQHLVFAMLGLSYSVFAYLPASNTRGGILIAAREADISMSDVLVGCFSLTVKVRHASQAEADDDRSWWLSSVYGPQDDSDKALFLEEIEAIRDACSGPWALAGDFNLILSEADKNNDLINRINMSRFRRTVADLELQDLHLHGRAFTWSNERERPTLVRLDRVLVSIQWEERFPGAHLRSLGSDASDHSPLLLYTNVGGMSKPRFHFEVMWPTYGDYIQVVMEAWNGPVHTYGQGPIERLDLKFKALIRALQSWGYKGWGDQAAVAHGQRTHLPAGGGTGDEGVV